MLRRSTVIVLGIFIVVAASLFWYVQYEKKHVPIEPTPTMRVQTLLFDSNDRKIIKINVSSKDGQNISLELGSSTNEWVIGGIPSDQADSTQIEFIHNTLKGLNVDISLESEPPLDAMGLTLPLYTVTLYFDNGEQSKLQVGYETPIGTGYYVKVDSSPAVVVAKSDLDAIINLLQYPPLLPTMESELGPTSEPEGIITPQTTETPGK